ncbi:MAG: phosphoglucosamine mutase, partial [Paludibacteraceae bacterium]|nr:phosphoglucosamine mutase [Paludibacteraceae bacterium]
MTLIKSISGIRGTIGGKAGEGLNPLDIVKFTAAYATWNRKHVKNSTHKIVVGRDARLSGKMVSDIVVGTLIGMGYDVIDIGLATTPTTELAVTMEHACGGLILTASHNPKQWNALKLLNEKGEFLDKKEGNEVLKIAEEESFTFVEVDGLGLVESKTDY